MRYRNQILFSLPLLVLIIFITGAKNGDTAKPNSRMYFAAIIVKNIDTSMAWYAKMYDLKLKNRVDNELRGFKQLNLVSDDMWIELVELKGGIDKSLVLTGEHAKSEIQRISKIGFVSDDIEAAFNEMKGKGAIFFGRGDFFTDPVSKKRGFMITDPDGNLLQYFEK